ncbi:MAG: hypothetical protein OXH15_14890 [Gammaproteobacteria bacterium]|nr:hypothetical protein [Gammaproteobacteria bacterium]
MLLVEEMAELCKGHVLPRGVGGRTWVVQRKDVDNFFGTFAEADYQHGVTLRALAANAANPAELLSYLQRHRLSGKVGLSLEDAAGNSTTANAGLDARGTPGLYLESDTLVEDPQEAVLRYNLNMELPTLVSCIHSVHLGLFGKMGYAYVSDKAGWFLASMLGGLYREYATKANKAKRDDLRKSPHVLPDACAPYRNLVRAVFNATEALDPRLLETPFDWFHVVWDGDTPVATIHYLKVRDECHAVMAYATFDERSAALVCSAQPLAIEVALGRFVGETPEFGVARRTVVWPCGDPALRLPPVPLSVGAKIMRQRMLEWTHE